METQRLVATRNLLDSGYVRNFSVKDGNSVAIPSSIGKQWSFRFERRKVVMLAGRRKYLSGEVRANKSGAGIVQVKNKDFEPEEEETSPAAGTKNFFKLPGTVKLPSKGSNRATDNNVVYVAGATGKVGQRVVRELVSLGFRVRAGVRNVEKAQFLLEEVEEESDDAEEEKQPKKNIWTNFSTGKLFGFLSPKPKRAAQQVELVQCDLEKDDIESALGTAGVVVCAIGASEKEVLDVQGPYRIDYKATQSLIDAASNANVNHFVLVTSLGTQKFGWPAGVLNLFWGVLYWKAKAEDALMESGVPYTILRPGGMEKPTDAYKETHNLRLAEADTLFGGQVSSLQVAELIGGVVSNLGLARNKVLEAVAETTAPLLPIEELLAEISAANTADTIKPVKKSAPKPSKAPKPRQEEGKDKVQAAKRAAETEREQKRQAADQQKTEALRQKLQSEYESARLREEEAREAAEAAKAEKEEVERKSAELRLKVQAAAQAAQEAKALETAIIAAARLGKKLSEREKQDIKKAVKAEFEEAAKLSAAKEKAQKEPKKKPEKVEAKTKEIQLPVKSNAVVAEERRANQEAENKARKDAEAKAAAEAKLAAKDKADAKAKAEAEEAERKRVEAEQRAKEEEEKNLKIEAEKNAEEEKIRIDAEKKQEEEEEKVRIEAEQKKEEEEQKIRIEAEQKALKDEAEKKLKEEEEEKVKLETALKASSGEDNITKQRKTQGFLWPWQKDESEEEAVAEEPETTVAAQTEVPVESKATDLPRPSRPLSPYTQFPGLKPPSPPSPPPAPKVQEGEAIAANATPTGKAEEFRQEVVETLAPEGEKQPKPKAFRWPWQKEESDEETDISSSLAEEVVPEEPKATLSAEKKAVPEESKSELPPPSRPLSPYTQFPSMKPPSSPTPSPVAKGEEERITAASETLTEPVIAKAEEITQEAVDALVPDQAALKNATKGSSGGFRWPWQKPEAEPLEEETLTEEEQDLSSTNNQTIIQETPTQEETKELPRTSRPLSPYTRFPGMKPPPSPSPPKAKQTAEDETQADQVDPINEQRVPEEAPEITGGPGAEEVEQLKVLAAKEVEEIAERERLAVEKATVTTFRWPWQKEEDSAENIEIEVPAETSSADSNASAATDIVPEVPAEVPSADSSGSAVNEVVPEIANSTETKVSERRTAEPPRKSLSPYITYPGLKPPPRPSPPKSPAKTEEPAEAALSEDSQPATETENGSTGPSDSDKTVAEGKVLEPASAGAFRWPWEE